MRYPLGTTYKVDFLLLTSFDSQPLLTSISLSSFSCTSIKKPPHSPHQCLHLPSQSLHNSQTDHITQSTSERSLLALMAPCSFSMNSNSLITVSQPIFIWLCPLLPPLRDQTRGALAVFPLLLMHCVLVYPSCLGFFCLQSSCCSPAFRMVLHSCYLPSYYIYHVNDYSLLLIHYCVSGGSTVANTQQI